MSIESRGALGLVWSVLRIYFLKVSFKRDCCGHYNKLIEMQGGGCFAYNLSFFAHGPNPKSDLGSPIIYWFKKSWPLRKWDTCLLGKANSDQVHTCKLNLSVYFMFMFRMLFTVARILEKIQR